MSIKLKGPWSKGFALDLHTESSEYVGDDDQGRPQFNTKRSEVGELLYKLKYQQDTSVVPQIIDALDRGPKGITKFDVIIPIPPSKKNRASQPVAIIAQELADKHDIPLLDNTLVKNDSQELKQITDKDERESLLKHNLSLNDSSAIEGKTVLLIDDLYRSGATLSAATELLLEQGAEKVCVLTLTKTRSNK